MGEERRPYEERAREWWPKLKARWEEASKEVERATPHRPVYGSGDGEPLIEVTCLSPWNAKLRVYRNRIEWAPFPRPERTVPLRQVADARITWGRYAQCQDHRG